MDHQNLILCEQTRDVLCGFFFSIGRSPTVLPADPVLRSDPELPELTWFLTHIHLALRQAKNVCCLSVVYQPGLCVII